MRLKCLHLIYCFHLAYTAEILTVPNCSTNNPPTLPTCLFLYFKKLKELNDSLCGVFHTMFYRRFLFCKWEIKFCWGVPYSCRASQRITAPMLHGSSPVLLLPWTSRAASLKQKRLGGTDGMSTGSSNLHNVWVLLCLMELKAQVLSGLKDSFLNSYQ